MTKCWAQIHSFEDFGKHKGVHINVFSTELIFKKILDNVKYITENGYLKEILNTLIFIFLSHCGPLHLPMFSTYNILYLFTVSLWFFLSWYKPINMCRLFYPALVQNYPVFIRFNGIICHVPVYRGIGFLLHPSVTTMQWHRIVCWVILFKT